MRQKTDLERLGDARLIARITDLTEALAATEAARTEAIAEYTKRRLAIARKGEEISGPLAEPVALTFNEQADLSRREQIAKQHFESDEAARRDPRLRQVVGA